MVLAKADGRIAAEYDRRLVPPPLQPLGADLRDRLARAIAAVRAVSGHRELLEATPVIRRSIDVRNPYVDPLNLVQVELLRRMRVAAGRPGAYGAHGHGQRHRRRHAKYGLETGGCTARFRAFHFPSRAT